MKKDKFLPILIGLTTNEASDRLSQKDTLTMAKHVAQCKECWPEWRKRLTEAEEWALDGEDTILDKLYAIGFHNPSPNIKEVSDSLDAVVSTWFLTHVVIRHYKDQELEDQREKDMMTNAKRVLAAEPDGGIGQNSDKIQGQWSLVFKSTKTVSGAVRRLHRIYKNYHPDWNMPTKK